MFEHLKDYNFILVTGPQRSGTTIAARMIAADTGKQFLPEGAMAVPDKMDEARGALPRLVDAIRNNFLCGSVVIQCPIQCRYIHRLAYYDTMIVMMWRDLKDIQESEKRIGWEDTRQRDLYSDAIKTFNYHIAKVKYNYWELFQRDNILDRNGYVLDLQYDQLSEHPLWIPKEQRKNFGPRQIGPEEDYSYFEVMV